MRFMNDRDSALADSLADNPGVLRYMAIDAHERAALEGRNTAVDELYIGSVLLAARVRAMRLERIEPGTVPIIDPLAHDAGEMTRDAARSLPMPPVLLAEAAVDLGAPELTSAEP